LIFWKEKFKKEKKEKLGKKNFKNFIFSIEVISHYQRHFYNFSEKLLLKFSQYF